MRIGFEAHHPLSIKGEGNKKLPRISFFFVLSRCYLLNGVKGKISESWRKVKSMGKGSDGVIVGSIMRCQHFRMNKLFHLKSLCFFPSTTSLSSYSLHATEMSLHKKVKINSLKISVCFLFDFQIRLVTTAILR